MKALTRLLVIFPPAQVMRFGLVGLVNTAVGLITYWVVIYLDESLYQLGNILGFLLSVLCAWFLSRHFVFNEHKASGRRDGLRTLLRSYLSYGGTTALAALLLYLLIEIWQVDPYMAPVLTLFVTVPANFLLNKFWTFAGRRRPSPKRSPQHVSLPVSGDLS